MERERERERDDLAAIQEGPSRRLYEGRDKLQQNAAAFVWWGLEAVLGRTKVFWPARRKKGGGKGDDMN